MNQLSNISFRIEAYVNHLAWEVDRAAALIKRKGFARKSAEKQARMPARQRAVKTLFANASVEYMLSKSKKG